MDLQQRTPGWHEARRGKLTASNLAALLGQVSYTSRKQAYLRALGKDPFSGNQATRWGTNNEPNGIMSYIAKTANLVTATGLHTHPHYNWLAGSPDGFVGTEGLIEVKCPYYVRKKEGVRLHSAVPHYYWIQMNALMEITGRSWCDYICWAPEGLRVFRVKRDPDTFEFLLGYYTQIAAAIKCLSDTPPPMAKEEQLKITERIHEAMAKGVDLTFWSEEVPSQPPATSDVDCEEDEDEVSPGKRQRVPEEGELHGGEASDKRDAGASEAVREGCAHEAAAEAAASLLSIRVPQVQV